MKYALVGMLCALFVSGCGDVYVTSTTVISEKPSRSQRAFPRGEYVFACTTMAGLYNYLDNNIISAGCGQMEMTAVTERGSYDSYRYGRVGIYQFMRYGYTNFTFFERGRRYRY